MKNVTIIIFTVLLVAAILCGFVFYGKSADLKDALKTRTEDVTSLNVRIHALEEDLRGRKNTEVIMRGELARKDAMVAELKKSWAGKRLQLNQKSRNWNPPIHLLFLASKSNSSAGK